MSMDCEMNFEMFPFDSQACPLLLESYAYGKSGHGSINYPSIRSNCVDRKINGPWIHETELDFEWKIDGEKSPIEYSEGLGMSDFMQGVKFVKYNCTAEYSTGPFSCLQGYFILDRQVGYYILWAFLPAGMVNGNKVLRKIGFWLKDNSSHQKSYVRFYILDGFLDQAHGGASTSRSRHHNLPCCQSKI